MERTTSTACRVYAAKMACLKLLRRQMSAAICTCLPTPQHNQHTNGAAKHGVWQHPSAMYGVIAEVAEQSGADKAMPVVWQKQHVWSVSCCLPCQEWAFHPICCDGVWVHQLACQVWEWHPSGWPPLGWPLGWRPSGQLGWHLVLHPSCWSLVLPPLYPSLQPWTSFCTRWTQDVWTLVLDIYRCLPQF